MSELYRSEDNTFLLYGMEGELYVAQRIPDHPNATVLIADEDLVATVEAMMAYAEERGLIHKKWVPTPRKTGEADDTRDTRRPEGRLPGQEG